MRETVVFRLIKDKVNGWFFFLFCSGRDVSERECEESKESVVEVRE